jgi:hypothetical protein|tara:strand:+ start:489 stop:1148 length:660 start_codon:yes stop_codon:yes gene_type:complete
MSSLSELIAKVNPGLSAGGVDSMLKLYSVDIFEADVSPTRPNVAGDDYSMRGYTRLDTQEYITPNTIVGMFEISVTDRMPILMVDYDSTGVTSPKGRTIRTNLFNKLAGWRWTSKNHPMLAESKLRNSDKRGPALISVDDGRDHFYTLKFDTGLLDGTLYTKKSRGEPRNRPSVKGRLVLGPPVGQIQILASKKFHYIHEYITVVPTDKDGLDPIRRSE